MQHAAADADAVLDLLQLRLRKLRACAGEDVLTAECMEELAWRLEGRARYREAEEPEELYRECLRIRLDLSFPQGATVIALVLRLVFFKFLLKGIGAVLLTSWLRLPQSRKSCIKVLTIFQSIPWQMP